MGKRVKPKGRNPRKQHRSQGSDLDPNQEQSDPKPNTTNEEETTKTREGCGHYTEGDLHLNKILISILSSNSEFSSCDHCRDELPQTNRKGGASGGKKKKKGGGAGPRGAEAKPNPNPIWVCLDCGRSFCGGEVDKEVPYGHARRHAKQERHNWAVGPASNGTAWCFLCNDEVPIEMPSIEEAITSTTKPTSEPDYTKAMKSDVKQESGFHAGPHHHGIRGLANLGNTCFFNSVLQNLLALKMLRESLLKPQNSDPDNNITFVTGPLAMSLRKLFLETNGEEDCKGVLSPKNLFGSICTKAPQFRGYQQQDSHELLRYLLDGLNTEETSARKLKQADSDKGGGADTAGPTLVDSMFSGRLSSTISCLDCGYTSVVHEPFLDLSLPVPAKKTSTVVKKGGNRPPLVRGRGRSQRSRDRPASKSSQADEKTRKHEDATENTSSKAADETESTVSKAGETLDPKSTFIEAGADISEEIAGSKEVDGSGSGAGPESTAAGMADFSWMDFLADQDSAAIAQEPSEAESAGPEVLSSDSTAPEVRRGSTVIGAGEAGLKQCTAAEAEPEVAVSVAETFCCPGNDDTECRMRLEGSLQESEPVKREITVSESTVVGQGAEGPQSISSEADTSCSAMVIGMKNIKVGADSAKELTGSKADTGGSSSGIGQASMSKAGPSCSMESTDSTNGSIAKEDDDSVVHDSSPCVGSDKWESTLSAKISDEPDSAFLSVKVVDDADLLPDQWDKTESMVFDAKINDANTSSSFVGSNAQELVLEGNIVKVDGDNGRLPGKYEEVVDTGLKVKADDDIDWLHDQGDELNGMVLKANGQDDMDWLMDEGSEIHITVDKTRVHAYSEAESFELESTVISVDDYVPGSMAFKESSSLCMDVAGTGSKPASPNQRLTSTKSDSQDRCGDSIIDTSSLPNSNRTKDEPADSSITQEDTKPETDTNTGTAIALHPPENTNEIETTPSTVNIGTAVQQEVEFDGFGDMFNEPEEAVGPVNRPDSKPEDEDDADSIFWGSGGAFSGFGFNNEEVDDTNKPVSVVSCLELFTKPELLTGEHAWHCEKCSALQSKANDQNCGKGDEKQKVMRDAMKRYLVDRAPQVLTVHLKRFSQDARGRLSKLRGHVNFEEILDLTPFVHVRSNDKKKCTYRLVGLVEHSGSMSMGHYVAYIRGEKILKGGVHGQTWFYASDAHVKEVSLSEVLRSEAYLLFYERVKNEN